MNKKIIIIAIIAVIISLTSVGGVFLYKKNMSRSKNNEVNKSTKQTENNNVQKEVHQLSPSPATLTPDTTRKIIPTSPLKPGEAPPPSPPIMTSEVK